MRILGVDTIFHDVCAAIMDNSAVLSNERRTIAMPLVSQSLLHMTELHVVQIGEVICEAMKQAHTRLEDLSLISANNSGSLLSNVLIGLVSANILSCLGDIPIIGVTHQEAHIFSNWIERNSEDFTFPVLVFSASGGHSLMALISEKEFPLYDILVETSGIAGNTKSGPEFVGLGFLFSKVVIELGLSDAKERLNGDGNFISQLANKGNAKRFDFFQISQKKFRGMPVELKELLKDVCRVIKKAKRWRRSLSDEFIFDIASSFQKAVSEIISEKLLLEADKHKAKEIHLVGGVSANEAIRNMLAEKARIKGLITRFPKAKSYCTDNAAMIANVGYLKFKQSPQKYSNQRHLNIKSDLILEKIAVDQFLKQNKKLG